MIIKNHDLEYSLDENFEITRQFNVYFDIDFPILFSFENKKKTYLGYTLEYDQLEDYVECIVVETDYDHILKLITQRESIRSILGNSITTKITKMNNHVDSEELNVYELNDILPSENYKLDYAIPNRVNLQEIQPIIEEKINKCKKITYSSEWDEISKSINYYAKEKNWKNYYRSIENLYDQKSEIENKNTELMKTFSKEFNAFIETSFENIHRHFGVKKL